MFAVVTSYSFDPDHAMHIFGSEEAAKNFMKRDYENELRIDMEENGWESEGMLDMDSGKATIKNTFPNLDGSVRTDITYWEITQTYIAELSLSAFMEQPVYMISVPQAAEIGNRYLYRINVNKLHIVGMSKSKECPELIDHIADNETDKADIIKNYPYFVVLASDSGSVLYSVVNADGNFKTAYKIAGEESKIFWSKEEAEADIEVVKQRVLTQYKNAEFISD